MEEKRYTLNIGWIHLNKGKYRVATWVKGDGTRSFTYDKNHRLDIEELIAIGKNLFSPKAKSVCDHLNEMDVCLSNFAGTQIRFRKKTF
jgi:hypothetical protein